MFEDVSEQFVERSVIKTVGDVELGSFDTRVGGNFLPRMAAFGDSLK